MQGSRELETRASDNMPLIVLLTTATLNPFLALNFCLAALSRPAKPPPLPWRGSLMTFLLPGLPNSITVRRTSSESGLRGACCLIRCASAFAAALAVSASFLSLACSSRVHRKRQLSQPHEGHPVRGARDMPVSYQWANAAANCSVVYGAACELSLIHI